MTQRKQKLELTWIGKEHRSRLEPCRQAHGAPRILLEDPSLSYQASHRVGENDLFDNLAGTLHLGECLDGLVSYLH